MEQSTVKEVLSKLSENEQQLLAEIVNEERSRLATRNARDMDGVIVKLIESNIK